MTKKDIVKIISEETGETQLKVKKIVQRTLDLIIEFVATSEEGRVELRNFGVFEAKQRAARKARNPRTGEEVEVEEKRVVTFKPGKEMEKKVRLQGKNNSDDNSNSKASDANPKNPPSDPSSNE